MTDIIQTILLLIIIDRLFIERSRWKLSIQWSRPKIETFGYGPVYTPGHIRIGLIEKWPNGANHYTKIISRYYDSPRLKRRTNITANPE